MPRNTPQIEDLSIVQLLGRLKPPQLWSLVVIAFGIISGAFTLGYQISDYPNSLEIKRLQTKVEEQTANQRELQARLDTATIRQRFVSDYERYLLADYKAKNQATAENIEEAGRARTILVDQIYTWWQKQKNSSVLTAQRIAKGFESGDSRLILMSGQSPESIWVIPPEIKYEVLRRR